MRPTAAAAVVIAIVHMGCAGDPQPMPISSTGSASTSPDSISHPLPATPPASMVASNTDQTSPATAPPPAPGPLVVATVNGQTINQEQVVKPLIEAYGLPVLLQLVQLELARQMAAHQHINITNADVRGEREVMLKGAFKDAEPKDYDTLLQQLLKQQNMTRAQFDILVETNAHLRKLAEPLCQGKITDDNLKHAFNMIYGEKVSVRDIAVNNLREAQEVRKRVIENHEDFGDVAADVSVDIRTRGLKGEVPAFSRQSDIPDSIKTLAFDLKDGEVSDAINVEGMFHVIKVIRHIAPTIAKFEDQKESVRQLLYEKLLAETMKGIRGELGRQAMAPGVMTIDNPELAKQFEKMKSDYKAQAQDEAVARREMVAARPKPATEPTTRPTDLTSITTETGSSKTALPTTAPATKASQTAPSTEAGRPPATLPGAASGINPAVNPGQPASNPKSGQ